MMTSKEFIDKQTELLETIPREFHAMVSYYAYEHGHSAGYDEILSIMGGLIADLAGPITAYADTIRVATAKHYENR